MYGKYFLSVNKTTMFRTNNLIKGVCGCRHSLHTSKYGYLYNPHPSYGYVYRPHWSHQRSTYREASTSQVYYSIIRNSKLSEDDTNSIHGRKFQLSYLPQNSNLNSCRNFHLNVVDFADVPSKPSSKVEETVQALKEKAKEKEVAAPGAASKLDVEKKSDVAKVSSFQRIKKKVIDECVHYYHGFRLLFIDINVSRKLVWRVLNGHTLRRREKKLLVRTVGDIFRLIPFSVFIIVPFMELLLPVFIKFFPGMLPSTFQTSTEKEDKMKQSLKVKLEMAKFLQQTLDEMAVAGKGHKSETAKEFGEFFEKVRSDRGFATAEEIMKFSKLFDDEITLDTLPRPQLMALCRVLEIQPFGTTNFLRFQLQMKLRNLAADDKAIQKEGVDSLNLWELQQACKARGMRALGMSEEQLKSQLKQWLDLSLNERVPPSLLLLSRAFILREAVPRSTTQKLADAISNLPESVAVKAKEALGDLEGKLDNKTKIDIIKQEVRLISEERKEEHEEQEREAKVIDEGQKVLEEIIDKAPVIEDKASLLHDSILAAKEVSKPEVISSKEKEDVVTSVDLGVIEDALDTMGKEKKKMFVEKEELHELKEELAEYNEDVQELKEIEAAEVKESKAARRLFKVVNKLIGKLDNHVTKLETEEAAIKKDLETIQNTKSQDSEVARDELLRIDELINVIKKIQTVPDNSRLDRISEVLDKMDADHDGAIRIDTVLKIVELIGSENLKLNNKQMTEIIDLIKKEEQITLQEQLEKMLEKDISSQSAKERAAGSVLASPTVETLVKPPPVLRDDTIKEKPKSIEEVSRETLQSQKLAAAAITKPPTAEPGNILDPPKTPGQTNNKSVRSP